MFAVHGGDPLFTVTEMRAGDPHTACIDVTVSGAAPNKTVLFAGQDITGVLASNLTVSVSAGPVTPGGCNRFVGSPVYNGSLADLSNVPGDGVATAWLPIAIPTYRFKLTVTAGPKLGLEQTASATFSWRTIDVSSAPLLTRTQPPPLPRGYEINGPDGPDSPITKVELKQDQRPWAVKALSAAGAVSADFLRHPQYPMMLSGWLSCSSSCRNGSTVVTRSWLMLLSERRSEVHGTTQRGSTMSRYSQRQPVNSFRCRNEFWCLWASAALRPSRW